MHKQKQSYSSCGHDDHLGKIELEEIYQQDDTLEETARNSWELMYEDQIEEKWAIEGGNETMSLDEFKDMYWEIVRDGEMDKYRR